MSKLFSEIQELVPFQAVFALSEIDSVSSDTIDSLSKIERREFEQCNSLKRQREFVSSRTTLKKISGQLGVGGKFEILKDELGQPYGKTKDQKYYVSIAHTDDLVFCGVSAEQPIGIDLEPEKRSVPSKLEHRISHPDEQNIEDWIPAIRLWTIKEAYIKLRGQGLRLNMNEVHIEQETEHLFSKINDDKRAKICSFRSKENWLAIAYYH